MIPNLSYSITIIILCTLCTQLTRFLPFFIFRNRKVPKVITYLGKILPMAVMTTLVIYCLRELNFTLVSNFIPQLLAVLFTVLIHLYKKNTLLSIFVGTASYMLMIQVLF